MSDQTDCSNSIKKPIDSDIDEPLESPSRKKLKLCIPKNRSPSFSSDNTSPTQCQSLWKYNEKNESVVAELSSGKLTLWQFLLELLMSDEYSNLIKWTDRNIGEFILIQAEEVAKLWGIRKDRNHRMNYDKLSRALRYYYQKNIIKKVHGHKFVYRFVSLLPDMVPSMGGSPFRTINKIEASLIGDNISMESSHTMNETENASADSPKSSTYSTKSQQQIFHSPRLPNKNSRKNDFNSTLSALFQAALLSLSNCNNNNSNNNNNNNNNNNGKGNFGDISQQMFYRQKDNEHCICTSASTASNSPSASSSTSRLFDLPPHNGSHSRHECICKPDPPTLSTTSSSNNTGMFLPGSCNSLAQFSPTGIDRQSLLHFSRHSINMQRLSQEILLHSCANAKNRLNHNLSNPMLKPPDSFSNNSNNKSSSSSTTTATDSPNPQFWLNQFAQNLCNSMNKSLNFLSNNATLNKPEKEDSMSAIKTEPISHSSDTLDESGGLAEIFRRFIKEFESKQPCEPTDSVSNKAVPTPSIPKYPISPFGDFPNSEIANLIKSQLESQSQFVWMPIPVQFAKQILDCIDSNSDTN